MEERIKNIEVQLQAHPELRDAAKKEVEELSNLVINVPKEDDSEGDMSEEDVEQRTYKDPKTEPLLNNS